MSSIHTKTVHAGEKRVKAAHALATPIYQTSTFTFENTQDLVTHMEAKRWGTQGERRAYGRYGNPTLAAAERKLAALENAESACLFASGMAAITTTLLTLLSAGDHVIFTDDSYHRTREFIGNFLSRFNIEATAIPSYEIDSLEAAIQPNTRLIFAETPTNPYLRILDLHALATTARRHGIITVVDSTFATPVNQRPIEFGIDLVIHSATKYLGGHNDLLAGAVAGSAKLVSEIKTMLGTLGAVSNANSASLLLRGLKTLALRVKMQNESTLTVAEFLQNHPAVSEVYYPGLPSHPEYAIAAEQMSGFGGVVTFVLNADLAETSDFIDNLELPFIAPSLGGTETLISQVALTSYYDLSSAERHAIGIKDSLVRLSVGIEDPADIIADLTQALDSLLQTDTFSVENGIFVMTRV